MISTIPRRLVRAARRRVGDNTVAQVVARTLVDVRGLLLRHPGLALELALADLRGSRDPAILPLVERAIRARPTRRLRRRRAELLALAGELTAAHAEWQGIAGPRDRGEGGDDAATRARMLEGRLRETDGSWLPTVRAAAEHLEPASRRRILHLAKSVAPHRWSGFTIRTLYNLHAQQGAGLEPVVVTKIGWPREVGITDAPRLTTFEGIEHIVLDRGPDYRPRSLPPDVALQDLTDDLVDVVREVRPAILHVHSGHRGGELVLPALALRAHFGIPVVYEVRGLFESIWTSDERFAESAELYHRRLAAETRLLREVDGVLAISEALAADFVARGVPPDRITVVPNGIDADALGRPVRDEALRERLGLAGRQVVGYLGNLDHWREGIDVLLAALARLQREGRRDIAVLVVGDGQRRATLEAEARRLGVSDSAVFTGRVAHESVGQYYAQMDVFANPRLDERASRFITPLKPYEAMAVGVPVLVSDLPALREIVDPPNRGAVAPPGDPIGLARAIRELLDDAPRRQALAAAAGAWVRSERTWAANGPRYREAYERILGPLDGDEA